MDFVEKADDKKRLYLWNLLINAKELAIRRVNPRLVSLMCGLKIASKERHRADFDAFALASTRGRCWVFKGRVAHETAATIGTRVVCL